MNLNSLYQELINRFLALPGTKELLNEPVQIIPDSNPEVTLLPENDIPSQVNRPEYRVTATIKGICGEAYTESPEGYEGTLKELLAFSLTGKGIPATTLAAFNAAMHLLGLCPGVFPDAPSYHFAYADKLCRYIVEQHGTSNLVLVGYDGYLVKRFMDEGLDFWTMDRNPEHITKDRFNHVIVNSGKYNREACFAWAKLLLVTGSTFCNGTVLQYLNQNIPLLFYGITCAGAATLLDLPWFPV